MKQIKVLVIDDSAIIRQTLSQILNKDPDIKVIGTAADPFIAATKLAEEAPDVITLDVEMPRMDGITFLRKIMSQHPIPVVIISSLTAKGTETAILAMEYGAISVIKKPNLYQDLNNETTRSIIDSIKGAARARVKRRSPHHAPLQTLSRIKTESMVQTTDKVIA